MKLEFRFARAVFAAALALTLVTPAFSTEAVEPLAPLSWAAAPAGDRVASENCEGPGCALLTSVLPRLAARPAFSGTPGEQAYVKASNTGADDQFGYSVALSGDGNTLAVGAYLEDSATTAPDEGATDAGAVYVFTRSGATWTQQAYVKASNPGADDQFGYSVALSGDGNTLAVGARLEDSATGINSTPDEGASDAGAAYVFTRSGATWTQQAYVKASNTGADDQFGISVALSSDGNTLAVGAPLEDSATTGINSTPDEGATDAGAAYVFTRSGATWTQQAYVKASNPGASDLFGYSVALSSDGNTLAVGAPFENSATTGINSTPNEGAASAGAAYVFTRSGATWTQQAYVKASNTGANDEFGWSVALSGDGNTLAVGARLEDSATTGINSTPDEGAGNAGAAYVFTRSGATWTQQAYVKASNTGANDEFGWSVALSGDGNTLAVGARLEDSATTGINSTPDEGAGDAGAVYVFTRSGATWTQQAYVKASNTGASDLFGFSVALSSDGNTLAVGAYLEDSATTGINSTPNEGATDAGAAYVFFGAGAAGGDDDPTPFVSLAVNGTTGEEVSAANPVTVTYRTSGCQGQEMFLVLNAPAMGITWSYLNAAGQWIPLPANLAAITPFNANGPTDGGYTLFMGNVPMGDYELYIACDRTKNGHLDYAAGSIDGPFDHTIVHVR